MNVNALTIRDLEYLISVAKHLHFGKAAQECHVSQPALSTQIMKLEDQLDMKIFERTNRTVTLTPMGEAVVKQAQVVMEEAKKLSELSQIGKDPFSFPLRIGMIATLGPYFVPHLLPLLRKKHPNAKFIFKEGLTHELLEQLRDSKLDLVVAAPTFNEKGFKLTRLFFEPFFLTAPKTHALLKKDPLRLKDLHTDEMVLLEDGHCLKDQTVDFCGQATRSHTPQEFQATSLETLRSLVASGMGYTLMPALAVKNDDRYDSLINYRALGDNVGREVVLVHRERFNRTEEAALLTDFIRKTPPKGVRV